MSGTNAPNLTIIWAKVESDEHLYVKLQYTDSTDPNHPEVKTIQIENADNSTVLSGIISTFTVTSTYRTPGLLDLIDALPVTYVPKYQ
jgi:hypothetical protein